MKRTVAVVVVAICLVMVSSYGNNRPSPFKMAKVYVADEAGGSISVIDLRDSLKTTAIDLTNSAGSKFLPHNVQSAPNGKSVWVTAEDNNNINQLIIIDPNTDTIRERVTLGKDLHLAHVVLDDESKNAFVTAEQTNKVIQVDATTYRVVRKFNLGTEHAPHGLRYSQGKLYVANTAAKSMSVINVADGKVTDIPLGGMAVQTAVSRDGQFIFITLYDTKEVIKYSLKSELITRIPLPVTARGPIQLYATPDSKLLYIADQGKIMDRPTSNQVFVVGIADAKVLNTIKVGNMAHGVVVDKDGLRVYVTNTMDNTVSVIDVATQKAIYTVPVGKEPNGISYWFKTGGMP
ncbi:hypothetical protein K8352_10465 [Flavobacteriaceae bacterium F89]|uniref:Uncharacterized protein n=1 Tax=Cerina litoralis TaxID=2874477 RepID=A0AAE3EWU3_9FLAO|nr:hypothetical protein [Cerina litoralis]MCG2461171.1 hypothetical protein [Cerina litoralis]